MHGCVPNNIRGMIKLKKLEGVSFCELNFYILCIKCKYECMDEILLYMS